MSQYDLLNLLEKEKRWMTTKEISNKLKVGTSATLVKLRKLRRRNEIIIMRKGIKYYYKIKNGR